MAMTLEDLVGQAKNGDKAALEEIVRGIQHKIYGMSLRMLGQSADAEDAAQEIIIKIITHLSEFRGECSFLFWAYRIASNHLLSARKHKSEEKGVSFELLQEMGGDHCMECRASVPRTPEADLMREESRANCVQTLLTCLEREERLAFILGEIFEFNGNEAAIILDITPAAFRKRLSRGRAKIRGFMLENCGLVNGSRSLQNDNFAVVESAGQRGFPPRDAQVVRRLHELNDVEKVAFLFRTYPAYAPPDSFIQFFKGLIESGTYRILAS